MFCPKCNGEMKERYFNGIEVDVCENCRGIFLDRGEIQEITMRDKQEPHHGQKSHHHKESLFYKIIKEIL